MHKGQYRRGYNTGDKEGMLQDLEFGASLIDKLSSNTLYLKEFTSLYNSVALTDAKARNISLEHAMTLARCALYMRSLPEKNGLSGIHRALASFTVTEMKELTTKYLTDQQRLGIVEAVEDGLVSHTNPMLHELVLDIHATKNLTYSLQKFHNKGQTKETLLAATKTSQKELQKGRKHTGYNSSDMVPNLYGKVGVMVAPRVIAYRIYVGEKLMALPDEATRMKTAKEEYGLAYNEYRVYCLVANMFGNLSRFDQRYVTKTGIKVLEVLSQPSYEPVQREMVADLMFHWEAHYLEDNTHYECPNGLRPTVEIATVAIKAENRQAIEIMHAKMRQEEGEVFTSSLLDLPTSELISETKKEPEKEPEKEETQLREEMERETFKVVEELDKHPGPENIVTEVFMPNTEEQPVLAVTEETIHSSEPTGALRDVVESSIRALFKRAVTEIEEAAAVRNTLFEERAETTITTAISTLLQSNDRILRETIERRINMLDTAIDDKLVEMHNNYAYLIRQTYNIDAERIKTLERENKELEERLEEALYAKILAEEETAKLQSQAKEAIGYAELLGQAFASIGKLSKQEA